jgi:cell division septation protein DedD/predicted Ser/Thr protein kinase
MPTLDQNGGTPVLTMAPVDNQATKQSEPRQWFSGVSAAAPALPEAGDGGAELAAFAVANLPSRYRVVSHVGTGGMGIVLKVMDLDTGEIVALKMLKPGLASAQAMQENLRKEVCLARKVTHKNVCRIYEFNRSDGAACISMEFVEGESLASKLRRGGAIPLNETLEIARQICAGLREAHLQGIVHRDLKPANIMVDSSGTVKIMDFGIARLTEEDGQMTGTIAGTPAYMAPEQLELKTMGPQTDIYSLGLLLYEMLTDVPAFEGDTPIATALKQIRELPRRPSEIIPEFPARVEAIIMKCLRKDPARRYQSVDELAAALETEYAIRSSVSWPVALKQHVAQLGEQLRRNPSVRAGLEKIRGTAPVFRELGLEIRRSTMYAQRAVIEQWKKAEKFLAAQDWRAMAQTRTGQAAVVLLGGALVFGYAAGRKGGGKEFAAAQFSAPSISALAAPDPNKGFAGASGGSGADHADLGRGNAAASDAPDENTNSIHAVPSSKKIKPQPPARNSRSSSTASSKAALLASVRPAAPVAPVDAQKIVGPQAELEAPVLPVVSTGATPKLINSAEEQKPAQTALFLEVGSFKDSNWAQNAVEKLSGLGYHAISVHQSRLWMQSFRVQVGPFADMKEVETAQKSLAAQGFKTHLVK